MRKAGHVFTILLSYLVGLALLVALVYGSLPSSNPDFLSAKASYKSARQQLMDKYPGCDFFIWEIKAGSVDVFDTAKIAFAKSDKWRNTFIKYERKAKRMEMVVATLEKGQLTSEGFFNVETTENRRTLLRKIKENNTKVARWELDSTKLYYQNLYLARERNYKKLKAIKIDLSDSTPEVTLSFIRKMSSIERKAFSLENHFVLNVKLTFAGKVSEIVETPVDI